MNGSVTYEGLILQGGINVDTGANLEELTVYENGVYNPSEGKDGFSKVTVEVPAAVLDDITITENGQYVPPIGVDGYNDILVSVPHPAPVLDDITITENGSYQPPTGVDGYDDITVNVLPTLDNISIIANGTYQPPSGVDGYDDITVNVPLPANGIYKQTLSGLPSPIATFTGADAPIDSLKASIVGVQSGSGDPSPSNVRPISGWTGCNVEVGSGDFYISTGTVALNNYATVTIISSDSVEVQSTSSRNFIASKQLLTTFNLINGKKYMVRCHATIISGVAAMAIRTSSNQIKVISDKIRSDGDLSMTFTMDSEDMNYLSFFSTYSESENGDVIYSDIEFFEIQETYTILFNDSSDNPIELYDGSTNITGDDWTGKKYKLEFDGSSDEDWTLISSGNYPYFRIKLTNGELLKANSLLCNRYTLADIRGATSNIGVGLNISGNSYLNIRPDDYATMTLEIFKTWLESNPLQVVVELATDMTGSHTPINIRSNGVTNISVNCGEVTELKYFSETP